MKSVLKLSLALLAVALLASCGTSRRVSPPSAAIQQLTVQAHGDWKVDLRLHNYSSIPMQFDRVELALTIAGQSAGSVQAAPAVVVRPERWLTPCVAMSRAHLRSSIHQMPFLHPRSNRQWFNLEVR